MASTPLVPPITNQFPIVDGMGKPTDYFIRYLQERGFDIDGRVTPAQVAQMIADWSAGRFVNTNFPLSGGGALSGDLSLDHEPSGVVAGVYGDATHVPQFNVDADGHITGVLEVPISGGGGGAMTLIESQTLSAAANVTLEAFAGGGYDEIHIVGRLVFSAGSNHLLLTMKQAGVYASANYAYTSMGYSSSVATNNIGNDSASSCVFAGATGATWGARANAGESVFFHAVIPAPDVTTLYPSGHSRGTYFAQNAGQLVQNECAFTRKVAGALQGVRIAPNSGNITGKIDVFGV